MGNDKTNATRVGKSLIRPRPIIKNHAKGGALMSLKPTRRFVNRRKLQQFDRRKRTQRKQANHYLRRQRLDLRRRWRSLKRNLRRNNAMLFWRNKHGGEAPPLESDNS